jgi:hypothetical protein
VITKAPVDVELEAVASVIVVAPLADSVVNAPEEGVVAPMVVLLIVPPGIVTEPVNTGDARGDFRAISSWSPLKLPSISALVSGALLKVVEPGATGAGNLYVILAIVSQNLLLFVE